MLRCTLACRRQMRPYYNLPSKSEHGRKMTGFLTPYRHWMWKQNELWRNVHEAQFEHLRKVYKRQWLESFRVNADEYIYKYNITKAAQLAQWEYEMEEQEKKRLETQQMTEGRQVLKKKHLDLLREFHERHFFFWYERASERLQSMSLIQYIPQSKIQAHIEKELDKYAVGSKNPYPLNFAGQMPLLEDREGNIIEVPEGLLSNHFAEHPDSTATVHKPHQDSTRTSMEEQLLRTLVSSKEEELEGFKDDDSRALSETIDDISREEEEREADVRVARSMEETENEREISRRAYIDRGKTGSKAIFRRPNLTEGDSASTSSTGRGTSSTSAADTGSTPMKRRKKGKLDKVHALQEQQDAMLAKLSAQSLKEGVNPSSIGKRGEVVANRGRIRDKAAIPTQAVLMQNPELVAGSVPNARVGIQDKVDQVYHRGKYKAKKDDDNSSDGEDL